MEMSREGGILTFKKLQKESLAAAVLQVGLAGPGLAAALRQRRARPSAAGCQAAR